MSNAEPTDPATPPEDLAVPAVADEPDGRLRADVTGPVPERIARRHGQHFQHGQHRGDDPDHAAVLRKLGVSRQSSQLTACIGTNFNNDGTALYQATAALFMAQTLGYSLSLVDQVVIVLTTLVASVGAGGIPSGSAAAHPLSVLSWPRSSTPVSSGGSARGTHFPAPRKGGRPLSPLTEPCWTSALYRT